MSLGTAFLLPTLTRAQLTPEQAAGLDLGPATGYAFIDLGQSTLGWNSGPIDGNVLLGDGVKVNLSGGNNGGLTSGHSVFYDSTANISGHLQNPITQVLVSNGTTQAVATAAQNVANYASSLSATQSFNNISGTQTIIGNGGLNVIDAANINNSKLTLSGSPNDYFVFNISGGIHTNQAMTLLGGVNPAHILFNLTGTGTVFQTSGGDLSYGIYLAANGGDFQFSNLNLTGALINLGGNVQFVSGAKIPTGVPEPGVFALFLVGGVALAAWRRQRAQTA